MLKWLFFCILLAVSVLFGISITASSGNVGFYFAGWTIEAPVWLAACALLVIIAVSIAIIRFFKIFFNLSDWLKQRNKNRKIEKSKSQTYQGMIGWLEGNYLKAEKHFFVGAKESSLPLVNYLSASQAACVLGETDRAENYLKLAESSIKNRKDKKEKTEIKTALALYQAEIYLNQGLFQKAIDQLEVIEASHGIQSKSDQLLVRSYLGLRQWEALERVLPNCVRSKAFKESEICLLQKQVYTELLLARQAVSIEALENQWEAIPKQLRMNLELIYIYAQALCHYQEYHKAEKIIVQTLKRQWDNKLVELYGKIKSEDTAAQLALAETWLEVNTQAPVLLLTLGRLCLQNQLWGKAQRYLEFSHNLAPSADTFFELGCLAARLGKTEESAAYFKEGLAIYLNQHNLKAPNNV